MNGNFDLFSRVPNGLSSPLTWSDWQGQPNWAPLQDGEGLELSGHEFSAWWQKKGVLFFSNRGWLGQFSIGGPLTYGFYKVNSPHWRRQFDWVSKARRPSSWPVKLLPIKISPLEPNWKIPLRNYHMCALLLNDVRIARKMVRTPDFF